jgi:hypothetical protein
MGISKGMKGLLSLYPNERDGYRITAPLHGSLGNGIEAAYVQRISS